MALFLGCLGLGGVGAGADRGVVLDRGAIVRGPQDERLVALEFTGDQYAEGGTAVLDTLRAHHAKASFFLTGRFLRTVAFRPLVARMVAEGHYVGPHSDQHLLYVTWDSPPKLQVTRAQFEADLAGNLKELNGFGIMTDQVRYFVPPYEHYTPEIADWSRQKGITLVNFTPGTRSHTDYMEDSDPRFVPADAIIDSILKAQRSQPNGLNGFLLLMHLGAGPKRTRDHLHERLPALLDTLGARGYRFVRVDELLDRAP